MGNGKILTVSELAEHLNVHRITIYRLLKSGDLPGFKIGSVWRFDLDEIKRWMASERRSELQDVTSHDGKAFEDGASHDGKAFESGASSDGKSRNPSATRSSGTPAGNIRGAPDKDSARKRPGKRDV